jgi:parallel beta-helix repeat protein
MYYISYKLIYGGKQRTKYPLIIGVIILLFGMSLTTSYVADETTFLGTIYVDGDNTEGPWDGTPVHPYQYIQDGIDNASDDDTVFVFNGAYYENIIVEKSLNIIGEDKDATIIDGRTENVDVVYVTASQMKITDFTIQCSGVLGSGVELVGCSNNIISNCNFFFHELETISIIHSSDNIISNCTILDSNAGIIIGEELCDNNIISDCYISTDKTGIRLSSSNSRVSNCTLKAGMGVYWGSNNAILNCHISPDGLWGIQMGYAHNNTLRNNTLEHCGIIFNCNFPYQFYHDIDTSNLIDGKPIYYLVKENNMELNETMDIGYIGLISCTNITVKNHSLHGATLGNTSFATIENCSFYENTYGIDICLSSNNIISNCSFSTYYPVRIRKSSGNAVLGCKMPMGSQYGFGVDIDYYSSDNVVSSCHIAKFYDGIIIGGYSSNNVISNCDISGNECGVWFIDDGNTISKCNIHGNDAGLVVEGQNNLIYGNNFIDNSVNAVATGRNNWNNDILGNYWDDWIGHRFKFFGFLPYRVPGTLFSNFDWHPAKEKMLTCN